MRRLLLLPVMLCLAVSLLSAAEFSTIEDLNGHGIGVQTAVLYEELIRERVPDTTFQYYTMPNDMILALKSGKIDGWSPEEEPSGSCCA